MRGQFGLTTLIIFIALIVTAAVAAGVIIYTTQTVQQQALQTGAQAKQRVSTGIENVRVLGYQFDGNSLNTNFQKVSTVAPIIRLMSGSNPINFNDITFLLTSENGKFISLSFKSTIPVAIHARLEGGNIVFTGFVYGNSVTANNVQISNCDLANYTGTYINISNVNNTCTITLNKVGDILSVEDALKALEEMKNHMNVQTPMLLLALSLKGENVFLEEGEIYEVLIYLGTDNALVPEEKYSLQILPKGGYVTQVEGVVPTVLKAPVEDIWAK